MALLTVAPPLREQLGNNASEALLALLNDAGNSFKAETVALVSERFERRLAEELATLRVEVATEFAKVRNEMATEFAKVRSEMAAEFGKVRVEMVTEFAKVRTEMARMETRILRWQFAQWVTLVLFLMGILLTTLRR